MGYFSFSWLMLEMETVGVVIDTLRPRRTESVVAAPPMEILPISPRASRSISVIVSPVGDAPAADASSEAAASSAGASSPPPPLRRASISSCEIISSLIRVVLPFYNPGNLYGHALSGRTRTREELWIRPDVADQLILCQGIELENITKP